MKRYLVLFLAAVLILSCFVGCRGKDDNVSENPNGMIEDTQEATRPSIKPSTQQSSTEDTQRPSVSEESQDPSQSEGSQNPSDSGSGMGGNEDMGGSDTESTQEDVVGRTRRARPLFR